VWRADGEAGELIAEIRGFQDFPGYYGNKEATNKKILRDVFKKVREPRGLCLSSRSLAQSSPYHELT
jgi:hypothetical protein